MKKYNKIIGIIISVLVCFSSCDYLDLEPEDGVIRDKYWATKEDVFSSLMGCYASMIEPAVTERYFIWGEARAEMTKITSRGWSQFQLMQNGDIASGNGLVRWSSFYNTINNCNTLLEYAKKARETDPSFTEDMLKAYEAEAVCIRALMYFYLVRTFGDVPLVLEASKSDEQNYSVPKVPQAEILDTLVAQLVRVDRSQNGTFPERGIPYSHNGTDADDKGRFTVWGLKALLADIYLWMEEYDKCLEQCNLIISSGQYALVPVSRQTVITEDISGNSVVVYYPVEGDIDRFFESVYVNGNSIESIFELQFGTDYTNFVTSFMYEDFNPNNGYLQPNSEVLLYNLFEASSIDKGYFDIRAEGVSYKQNVVWKYMGLSRSDYNQQRTITDRPANWIFYRFAEILLMKAEALNQLGKISGNTAQLEEALALVQEVRKRANAPETTDLIPEGTATIDAQTLEQFILDERAREFTFEGKRWFDVLRNAKRDNYASPNINYLITLASYAAESNKILSLQSKWRGDYNSHYLPIAESEIQMNKALVQNPFYE